MAQENPVVDWKLALETVADGVATLDAEWRFLYVNHRAEMLFRRKRAELLGRSWWEVFPYLEGTATEDELRAAAAGGIGKRFRVFHAPLYVWHEVQATCSGGGLLLVLRDATDVTRMQQTEAVRTAVRDVFDQVPVAISILRGPDHRVEIMNPIARQVLGGRNLEGSPARAALPELEGQGFFELLDEVYSTGKPFEGKEVPVRFDPLGDGVLYDGVFNILYQPLLDNTGKVNGVLSLSVDVTGLVRERERLERRAAEQEAILGQLAEGVIVTDASGRITFVNEAAQRLHGVDTLEVLPGEYAQSFGLLTVGGEPYPSEDLPLSRAVLRDEVVRDERWRIRRPDGSEVLVEGSARPVFADGGGKVAAVLTLHEVPGQPSPAIEHRA